MNKIGNIKILIKDNQRYFWVLAVFVLFFLVNYSFPANVITSENCSDGQCEKMILEPQLSDQEIRFYQNDLFSSQKNEYFRLIFQSETNQDTEIEVFATNPLDQEKLIQSFKLKKTDGAKFKEVVLQTDGKYTDFLFVKKNQDGAKIFVKNIRLTKLNVKNENDLAKIKPTIFGEIKVEKSNQEQTKNDFVFNQLVEPDVILGQVFQAKSDFIAEVELDINVIKQGAGNGDKYALDLREAEFDGITPRITSRRISTLKFSAATIEQYRQANGKFLFPIMAPVRNGEYYFIGLDNQKVEVNQFNHLALRGSSQNSTYPDGNVAVKFKGDSFPAQGDLYFKTFGANFKEIDGKKVLLGTTIEDLGNGGSLYKFQPDDSNFSFVDFLEFTSDIEIDSEKKTISGSVEEKTPSEAIYKFETIYPFKNFRVYGEDANPDKKNLKIAYSFDKKEWIEILPKAMIEDSVLRVFDFSKSERMAKNLIYVKIFPQDTGQEKGEYGVKNFRFEANLITQ